jgi:hypothetical protein
MEALRPCDLWSASVLLLWGLAECDLELTHEEEDRLLAAHPEAQALLCYKGRPSMRAGAMALCYENFFHLSRTVSAQGSVAVGLERSAPFALNSKGQAYVDHRAERPFDILESALLLAAALSEDVDLVARWPALVLASRHRAEALLGPLPEPVIVCVASPQLTLLAQSRKLGSAWASAAFASTNGCVFVNENGVASIQRQLDEGVSSVLLLHELVHTAKPPAEAHWRSAGEIFFDESLVEALARRLAALDDNGLRPSVTSSRWDAYGFEALVTESLFAAARPANRPAAMAHVVKGASTAERLERLGREFGRGPLKTELLDCLVEPAGPLTWPAALRARRLARRLARDIRAGDYDLEPAAPKLSSTMSAPAPSVAAPPTAPSFER